MILKPIEGEEWIEKFRGAEFWISASRGYPQKFYSRLTKSYIGWWLYLRVHGRRASLLINPLSSGGLYSHLRCFLYNWIVADLICGAKHYIWKMFHREEWKAQCAFMRARFQASEEGCADPMSAPDWLPADRFHVSILGERYFKRVKEILDSRATHGVRHD